MGRAQLTQYTMTMPVCTNKCHHPYPYPIQHGKNAPLPCPVSPKLVECDHPGNSKHLRDQIGRRRRSPWSGELHRLEADRGLVRPREIGEFQGQELRRDGLWRVHVLRRLPFLREPVPFQHPDHLGHPGAVGRVVLCAQQGHLHHLLQLHPVVVAAQVFVHHHVQLLFLMELLYLEPPHEKYQKYCPW